MSPNVYDTLFEQHRSNAVQKLWRWQEDVLDQYANIAGDVAVELPTGAGKTLIGLLAGEHYRQETGKSVAYLAGTKQLAQQVERWAVELDFPVVRFEGSKDSWDFEQKSAYNFGNAIGVMNYWNYFNAKPGIEPAGQLILDDVHLLEGPLRDLFTLTVDRRTHLLELILREILDRCPYYPRAEDLLNDLTITHPPEMIAFPDSADLSGSVRELIDPALESGSAAWWSWQNIRDHLSACCWLVSGRGVTFTPYIPPSQTLEYFSAPDSRLYLSATIGNVEDLERRLGAPPVRLVTAAAPPRQGERLVVVRDDTEPLTEAELVETLEPFLKEQKKALWLCARKETAENIKDALVLSELDGAVAVLESDNAADEPFAEADSGHLVTAGRYDGLDFPGDACRVEVIPEVPIATSDLEEFVSAFLRDAPFAQARFGQRLAQALGRCNRGDDDRAVYVLTDPEFLGRFGQRRVIGAIPGDARDDIFAGASRANNGLAAGLDEARRFLEGTSVDSVEAPVRDGANAMPATAAAEVEGSLGLWNGSYRAAADQFNSIAGELNAFGEYRGFWLAMRGLAFKLATDGGDARAARRSKQAFKAAVAAGGPNSFFTRLGHALARIEGEGVDDAMHGDSDLFAAWDRLMERLGTQTVRFEKWAQGLHEALTSEDHDTVARGIAQVGSDLLGLEAEAPQATNGEEDANWRIPAPRRSLSFEVKLAPKVKAIVNKDVSQAEGAARALESQWDHPVKGLLVTPHTSVEDTAIARLDRVRLITVDVFLDQVDSLLDLLREFRGLWDHEDAALRKAARDAVVSELPPLDWIWRAAESAEDWVTEDLLDAAWDARPV
jgi:hypothetical protein